MSDEPVPLDRRLREADSQSLLALIEAHEQEIDGPAARQALRNPFLTREAIEKLLELNRLLGSYELRRDIALHPQTPEAHALRLIPGLFWGDLLRLGSDVRVRPVVRRSAEKVLERRLPTLSLGEKIAIARRASSALLVQLCLEGQARVLGAVLENPRLTEGTLLSVINRESTPGAVLTSIVRSPRWGARYTIRLAVVRHRKTPPALSVELVSQLKKTDLRSLLRERRLPPPVLERCRLLLGQRS